MAGPGPGGRQSCEEARSIVDELLQRPGERLSVLVMPEELQRAVKYGGCFGVAFASLRTPSSTVQGAFQALAQPRPSALALSQPPERSARASRLRALR